MTVIAKVASDSLKLDRAFVRGKVREAIESLATEAREELDHDDDRDAAEKNDATVV